MAVPKRKRDSAADTLLSLPPDYTMDLGPSLEQRQRRVFDAAVEMAIRDDTFRKRLAAQLRGLGEDRPKRSTSAFDVMQVATAVELMTRVHAGTRKAHLLKKPRLFDEVAGFLGITASQAKKRYYMARKGYFSS